MIITIDGPAGSGKSSTAKEVAKKLGFIHLDTGAMYRAITYKALSEQIDKNNTDKLLEMVNRSEIEFVGALPNVKLFLDGTNITKEIRSAEVTASVADYCTDKLVRAALVKRQQVIGNSGNTVCEGRDMATVVFPNAELQIYMTASPEARALRRVKDFAKIGETKTVEELVKEIKDRDEKDSNRANSPLKKSKNGIELDTTDMTFEEQVDFIVNRVKKL